MADNTASYLEVEKQELLKIFEDEVLVDQFLKDMETRELNRESKKLKKPAEDSRTISTEMVIITNNTLQSIFEQFAKIKNEEGIKTKVVTTATTGTTTSAIRSYLYNLKNSNPDLKYVLIGGDDSIIPTKSFNWIKNGVTKTASTDFYYSNVLSTWPGDDDINDIVLTPDLYVGRVPARNVPEVYRFKIKYTDFRKEHTVYVDRMAFIATNIQKEPGSQIDNITIDKVIDNLGTNITTDVLYTDDLVDTLNGCAKPVIDMLQDRHYSFLYGIWHGGDSMVIIDSEYDSDDPWYECNFGKHKQYITINEYRAEYGTCWYSPSGSNIAYYYSNSADNYLLMQDEIPNNYGSSYVAWIGSCYTADMNNPAYHEPVQFDNGEVVQNYSFSGADSLLTPYYVSADPDSVVDSANCISEEFFNEIGGPIAIYATSADDSPYFTYKMVEEYMDLQFEDDHHKLGYLTRESWNKVSHWFNVRQVREMYIGYTLFGDPSMDVWSAKAEQLVTILAHGGIQLGYTFTSLNSSGVEVDAEIVVTNSAGTIMGKGSSPYTYSGRMQNDYIITSNRANYIQARNTYSVLKDYTSLPYSMTFENGIDYNWEMHSSNSHGRTLVTDQNTPHSGNKHLTMDCDISSWWVVNEAWLHIDLTDEDRVELNFWWKEFNDETHAIDGVYFSDDGGTNFTKVYSLTGGSTSWQEIALDVDALCSNYSLDYSSDFVIKFQQYDNCSIQSDGFAFDDVSVYSNYSYIPYSTGFESTEVDKYWEIESSNGYGRVLVTSANSPHSGSKHLTMDVNTNGNYSVNEATLHLNFTNVRYPELKFWWKEFGDETHSTDGIYFSDDGGSSFEKVYDLSGSTNNIWQEIILDINQLAANNNLELTSKFVIKFQQYDNYQISSDGFTFDDINVIETGGGSRDGIDENEIISNDFLLSNHPNPFNPTTTISFSIPEEGKIELLVYNIKGQKVKTLLNDDLNEGNHSVVWYGVDESGNSVSSGVYFYNLIVNGKSKAIKKCLMMK